MEALVHGDGGFGALPVLEDGVAVDHVVDLDAEGTAAVGHVDGGGLVGLAPAPGGEVAAGTGGEGADDVDLGEELPVVASLGRTRFPGGGGRGRGREEKGRVSWEVESREEDLV